MGGTLPRHAPLYPRLPHGPSGLGRDAVARNQRTRIYGAMIESVAQRGYQATTVADVIGLAGVSRRAFYEQFANKQDCFLGTYDIVVARGRKRVVTAWGAERGWANRLHASVKALLDHAAEEPKGPHLVLVDTLGIGPAAHERMQRAGFEFERLLTLIFQLAPDGVAVPPLAARAIVGGLRHVVMMRLLEGRERELAQLVDEALDWVQAYRAPMPVAASSTAPLGRGAPGRAAAAFLAGTDCRSRALGSVVELTLGEGFATLTDPQIAHFAGMTTEAFHRQFASKEAAYLAVLDEMIEEASMSVRSAIACSEGWPQAVRHAMSTFIDYLVEHEPLQRIAFVDVFDVGPAMVGRITRAAEAVTGLLADGGPAARHGPAIAEEAVTGALWSILSSYAAAGLLPRLPRLAEHLSYFVLAPYLGPRAAHAVLAEPAGAAPPVR
jgi:AcrR family transcriptional regulator